MVPQFLPCAAQVVGVHVAVGLTVRSAVAVPPSEAEMVVTVVAVTAEVVTPKVAAVCPAGMTTFGGTLATPLLLERSAVAPPDGAAMFSVTVPVDEPPPVTEVGLSASDDTLSDGAGAASPSTVRMALNV